MLSFTCAMPCGVFLAWLACWLLSWKFTFLFRAAGLSAECLGFSASLLPGEGSWFLRLAWRYGRCFWRRPFPFTWCFPDAGGNVSVSTFLGWFAILEVLVLKSRDSRFSWSLTLLAWCLEFWVPYPVAPLLRVALWFFRSSRGARGALPDIWPRASVSLLVFDLPLAWSLRLWGDPCLGVQWLSFRVRVLCPLLRHVDVALQDLPCSSVGGLHCPGPVNARIIAWEIVFSLGERSGFLACLGRRIVCRCVPFLFVPGFNVVRSSISVLLLAPDAWARGCGPWFTLPSVACPVGRSHSCCRSVSSL